MASMSSRDSEKKGLGQLESAWTASNSCSSIQTKTYSGRFGIKGCLGQLIL